MDLDGNILTILKSEDREEIRAALKRVIINQIEDDFRENCDYLFDIDDINGMIEEALEEVKEEIKPIIKEHMLEEMNKKLGLYYDKGRK